MAPSVEMTNLPRNAHHEYAYQEASSGSYNMVKVATLALAANRNLQHFIIAERAPRYDQWESLNKYANEELYEALQTVENEDQEEDCHREAQPGMYRRAAAVKVW